MNHNDLLILFKSIKLFLLESDDFDFWLKFWLTILEQRFELRGQTLGLVKSYTKDNQRADIIYN